jgi:hypothetical protein
MIEFLTYVTIACHVGAIGASIALILRQPRSA